jgi:hypothetical protein
MVDWAVARGTARFFDRRGNPRVMLVVHLAAPASAHSAMADRTPTNTSLSHVTVRIGQSWAIAYCPEESVAGRNKYRFIIQKRNA